MKTFNNTAGTTSSEFSIGVGTTDVRQVVLGAFCDADNTKAVDREGNELAVQFFDIKILAVDQDGNRLTKQLRGTVAGTTVNKIEDTFEEGFDGGVQLTSASNVLSVNCLIGSAISATYSIYVTLQRIS
jgi:hypothetical protein